MLGTATYVSDPSGHAFLAVERESFLRVIGRQAERSGMALADVADQFSSGMMSPGFVYLDEVDCAPRFVGLASEVGPAGPFENEVPRQSISFDLLDLPDFDAKGLIDGYDGATVTFLDGCAPAYFTTGDCRVLRATRLALEEGADAGDPALNEEPWGFMVTDGASMAFIPAIDIAHMASLELAPALVREPPKAAPGGPDF
jgi:hypothetical protein